MHRLGDFGLSQHVGNDDTLTQTAGTVPFFAPEMLQGKPFAARKADVWAMGATLHWFIYGVR